MQFSEYKIKEKSLVVGQVVLGLLIVWSLLYNILIKKQQLFEAFFGIIDTLTEDLFMRAGFGLFTAISLLFAILLSRRYAQMLSLNHFFRQMEILFCPHLSEDILIENPVSETQNPTKKILQSVQNKSAENNILLRIFDIESMPRPLCNYPLSGTNALVSLAVLYVFHVLFLVILSESIALLVRFNSTDVLINGDFVMNVAVMTLSLPLSIRILAALEYKGTRDVAQIIPFLSFICILFMTLPIAFDNMDASFLESVYNQSAFWNIFVREILLLAFIPTFFEGILWMLHIFALKEDT